MDKKLIEEALKGLFDIENEVEDQVDVYKAEDAEREKHLRQVLRSMELDHMKKLRDELDLDYALRIQKAHKEAEAIEKDADVYVAALKKIFSEKEPALTKRLFTQIFKEDKP